MRRQYQNPVASLIAVGSALRQNVDSRLVDSIFIPNALVKILFGDAIAPGRQCILNVGGDIHFLVGAGRVHLRRQISKIIRNILLIGRKQCHLRVINQCLHLISRRILSGNGCLHGFIVETALNGNILTIVLNKAAFLSFICGIA